MPHRFEKAEYWAKEFDSPDRDTWQKPEEVASMLELRGGMTVVDLGAGTGYFEAYLAWAVSASGTVIAADVEPDMVRYLGERAKRETLSNVRPLLVEGGDPKLDDASVDRVLVVDTWHHLGSRAAYAAKLARALKPGGFVLVVDFTMETDKGPPKEHRIDAERVVEELGQAGLRARIVDETLPDQYVVRADKSAAAPAASAFATASGGPASPAPRPSASTKPLSPPPTQTKPRF